MRMEVYDCEVFKYDWIVVFKDISNGKYTVIHNDNEALYDHMDSEDVYFGFNSKHYDQYILKGICSGFLPEELKSLSDYLIAGGQGWEYEPLQDVYFRFNNVDIKDDLQMGLSLKAIEGHLGMDIEESQVDFNITRKLTVEEVKKSITYCKHDVDATEALLRLRKSYIQTKANLGKRAGIPMQKAISLTNAKLTALMLHAKRVERNDGREYVYPSNLDLSVIPQEILDFFETIHDTSLSDKEVFKTSLKITLFDMECTYAWGGVHGSLKKYIEHETDTRVIQNRDVSSLYPSLIEIYNYLSRNVPNPELFYDIKKDRIHAKHVGDKQTAKDLKLPLNTVSGAQENQFNDLYDPLPTRSMRISGQLFLTVLLMRLGKACKTIRFLNFNTDGLAYSVDKSELDIVDTICAEWEKETKFELETDNIKSIYIKDVNNLLFIDSNNDLKTVGGYLNHGISVKGAWSINNTMVIVKKALINYMAYGIPIEWTINACDNILDFQIIAKAGSGYSGVYQMIDDEKHECQKVNRVYATSNPRYGKLYKYNMKDLRMINDLPDNCIIDNANKLSIEAIDKSFYINLTKKRLKDFIGKEV